MWGRKTMLKADYPLLSPNRFTFRLTFWRWGVKIVLSALFCLGGQAVATAATEQAQVKKLQRYFKQDKHKPFLAIAEQIRADSVYTPLVGYWGAILNLRHNKVDSVFSFIDTTGSDYFRHRAQNELLTYMFNKKQWHLLRSGDMASNRCAVLYEGQFIKKESGFVAAIKQQWQQDTKMNDKVCLALYRRAVAAKLLSREEVWVKITQIAGTQSLSTTRRFLAHFPGYIRYKDVRRTVLRATRYIRGKHGLKSRGNRALVMIAAMVSVRHNPKTAIRRWRAFSRYFNPDNNDQVWSVLGEWAARWHRPDALKLLSLTSGRFHTDNTRAWRLRAALREKNYALVEQIVSAMPPEEQAVTAWQYWRAFALAQMGDTAAATEYYRALARDHDDYYGLLAQAEVGVQSEAAAPPSAPPLPLTATPADPDLQLALALHRLDATLARKIWRYKIKQDTLSDKQRLSAAQSAHNKQWYLGAIEMADSVKGDNAHALAYPLPYRPQVHPQTQKFSLDPAFVFGLMRQESRFMKNIVSPAGAQGLMQVMPRTARNVARKKKYTRYHISRLKRPDTNVIIGTTYLTMLVQRLGDSPAKVAAGYNAGPGRVKRWFSASPNPLIAIENIPLTETRLYVKYLLANRAHYDKRLGNPVLSMKEYINKPIISY